jgi:hypothetical protein
MNFDEPHVSLDVPIIMHPIDAAMMVREHEDAEHLRRHIAYIYDVPPWLLGLRPVPRFPRLRWALRKVWPV